LDEAQRIKNFSTKTHRTVMDIPHDQAIVLTGTPLENRLEDLYAIVQFADPELLTPLWLFAVNYYLIDPKSKAKPFAYHNLDQLHQRLSAVLIRRRKAEVFQSLPREVTQTYRVTLTERQRSLHDSAATRLAGLLSQEFLTPMDLEQIQRLLQSMRMACDSSFLLDHETTDSPKLAELEIVLRELVVDNGRKVVLFTEWTTMARLIAARLELMGIGHVLFSGDTPVEKRQALIDRFQSTPDCMVFLSTDAGGVGLNLQNADCVINFELPWNPARLAQRIGRVNRIGQASQCINVVNFVTENSIEENVLAGIALKEDLFHAALDGSASLVDMGSDRKKDVLRRLREIVPGMNAPTPSPAESDAPESTIVSDTATGTGEAGPAEAATVEPPADQSLDLGQEEGQAAPAESEAPVPPPAPDPHQAMRETLENGLRFLSGLAVMAGGKPLLPSDAPNPISVDPATGEVVIRFKMPV
jgi:SNF2 family DNA or RNA helicase